MRNRAFIFSIIWLSLFSCKKEIPLSFSEIEKTSPNNTLVSVNIPFAKGQNIVSQNINNEIQDVIANRLTIGNSEEDTSVNIESQIEAFNIAFQEFKNTFPDNINQYWEAQIDGEVMYNSTEIISIAITSYLNTGGAHGNTSIAFLNFNASNGHRIKTEHLFKDLVAFKTLAKNYFDKTVTDKAVLFKPKAFALPANIGFIDDGIILLYNPYEIAPYSTGIIEFKIPFSAAQNYLKFK